MSEKSFTKKHYSVGGITVHPHDDGEELRQKLELARKHLHDLKTNRIVLARTRTVTRLSRQRPTKRFQKRY
ncbi:unnamed protein product [Oikopleura dioica]|uniref:Uncharacterized protein n=1 Tax=Oikopleura dioica TaxID=34765 RepID=E4Y9V9_OIKDI|nr:unnamed protein product [Oikopleura dioica]